jgi:cytochrome d ubiquinol oxidase subunit I
MELDPLLLSRIQFAFVVSFHAIFPVFTIGLAAWIALLEALNYPVLFISPLIRQQFG